MILRKSERGRGVAINVGMSGYLSLCYVENGSGPDEEK